MWFKKETPKLTSYEETSLIDLMKDVRKEVKVLEEEKSKLLAQTIVLENRVSEVEKKNKELQDFMEFNERLLNVYRIQLMRLTGDGYGEYLELEKIITTDSNRDEVFITVEGRVTREVYDKLMKRKNAYAILKFISKNEDIDEIAEKEAEKCLSEE